MKKIILSFTAILILFLSCDKGDCEMKRPKDVKSIDWENYNDVYTVYWNYVFYNRPGKINEEDCGKDIMLCGFASNWDSRPPSANGFIIVDNANEYDPSIHIQPSFWEQDSHKQLQTILDTGYLANMKCYVKGKLYFKNLTPTMEKCQTYQPIITIDNVNDIYFKEEE
jgi:hypothetical protein